MDYSLLLGIHSRSGGGLSSSTPPITDQVRPSKRISLGCKARAATWPMQQLTRFGPGQHTAALAFGILRAHGSC